VGSARPVAKLSTLDRPPVMASARFRHFWRGSGKVIHRFALANSPARRAGPSLMQVART